MDIEEKVQVPEAKSLRWVANMLGGVDQEKGFPRTAAFYCQAAAGLIESLQAQLTESQRRERAAVKDIPVAHDKGRCEVCKHKNLGGGACNKWPDRSCFEWRGPQDGKGVNDGM